MPITFIAHAFYYTTVSYLMSRLAAYIPIAKARGFTPLFGNGSCCGLPARAGGRIATVLVSPQVKSGF